MKGVRTNGMGIFVVLLAICFSLAAVPNGLAAEVPDSPLLVYGLDKESGTGGVLIGGFSKDKWWEIEAFPFSVNGKPVAPDMSCADNMKEEEINFAETPLLPKGIRLKFYTMDGAVAGTGVTTGVVRYECYEANGQPLLSPELGDLTVNEVKTPEEFPFIIGLREDVPVGFVQTKRTEEKDKRVSFSAEFGGKPVSVVYTYIGKDQDPQYAGELVMDGKARPFASALISETEQFNGYFVDLYKDGLLEFFGLTDGPAAGVALYSLSGPDPAKALMSLDEGE